jgi:hypothetical protein
MATAVAVGGCNWNLDFGDWNWKLDLDGALGPGPGLFSPGTACAHGTASCGADASACETDILDSDEHCGGCMVKCASGHHCVEGSCFEVQQLATWSFAEVPLISGGLAVGAGTVFMGFMDPESTDASTLYAVPAAGGTPRGIARGNVSAVAAEGDEVYFVSYPPGSSAARLLHMRATDTVPATLLPDGGEIDSLVGVDPGHVYLATARSGCGQDAVLSAPLDGGAPTDLLCDPGSAAGPGLPFAAVASGHLYWSSSGDLYGESFPHGVERELGEGIATRGVVASTGAAYGIGDGGVTRWDLDSGTTTTTPYSGGPAVAVAADDSALYAVVSPAGLWGDSQILRIAPDGVTVLAGAQIMALEIAIDDTFVYWWAVDLTDAGDQRIVLRRMAKSP